MRDDAEQPAEARLLGHDASDGAGAAKTAAAMEKDGLQMAWGAVAEGYAAAAEPWTSQAAAPMLAVARLGRRSEFLDLGCGAGAMTLAAQTLGALATGVDLSPKMIAAAQARPGAADAAFRIGDARALDAREGAYDAVAAGFSVLETGAPEQTLKEAYRALRPGGRLVWTCWPGQSGGRLFEVVEAARLSVEGLGPRQASARGVDAEAAVGLTRAAGFERVEATPLELLGAADPDAVLAAVEALDPATPAPRDRAGVVQALKEALAGADPLATGAVLIAAEKVGDAARLGGGEIDAAPAGERASYGRPRGLVGRLAQWFGKRK